MTKFFTVLIVCLTAALVMQIQANQKTTNFTN